MTLGMIASPTAHVGVVVPGAGETLCKVSYNQGGIKARLSLFTAPGLKPIAVIQKF